LICLLQCLVRRRLCREFLPAQLFPVLLPTSHRLELLLPLCLAPTALAPFPESNPSPVNNNKLSNKLSSQTQRGMQRRLQRPCRCPNPTPFVLLLPALPLLFLLPGRMEGKLSPRR
jgi:hypothetical protein